MPEAQSATAAKLQTAKQKKETGDQAFKNGDVKAGKQSCLTRRNALQSIGIGPSVTPQNDKDGKDFKEKTEALDKNENNYKVQFRKAKALGEQGYYEKAVKILEDIKGKNPSDAAIYDGELARLRTIDNERDRANKAKLKGFLNREKKAEKTEEVDDDKLVGVKPPPSATIEEVV
ncbi:hypothetical protein C0993_004867 [Termitomyces sp. T159_Od127]|nr:hypothetical protein C0993_004867 [Termitomyces sp. T159_Od127]